MPTHAENRDSVILGAVREELIGPSARGTEIDCSKDIRFDTPAEAAGPWREKGTLEEILTRDKPTKRYGVAVLYPFGTADQDVEGADESQPLGDKTDAIGDEAVTGSENGTIALATDVTKSVQDGATLGLLGDASTDSEDLDVGSSNPYRPSSMGVTFLARLSAGSELRINASGGRYVKKRVAIGRNDLDWWVRRPWSVEVIWTADQLCGEEIRLLQFPASPDDPHFHIAVEAYSRPYPLGGRMITVTLVNRTVMGSGVADECCLFQAAFNATLSAEHGEAVLQPYPEASSRALDEEEQSISLLYRHAQTYAIGHGCAADWTEDKRTVHATCLPIFEAPSVTPDVLRKDGTKLEVPMSLLAGLVEGDDGFSSLEEVITLYDAWIADLQRSAEGLPQEHHLAASRHVSQCLECANRMRNGLEFIRSNQIALQAFRLANHSILLQQLRGRREPRRIGYDERNKSWSFSEPYPPISYEAGTRGNWRAFQIAFLLLSIRSAAEGKAPDREVVELIWFPTGGGKTEAYLGLSAFSMFFRRLTDPSDDGVQVLMRYTLRLLTAQQFQRASGLITAMEYLRRKNPAQLGTKRFSIGIWLGGSTTPNTREDAIQVQRSLAKGERGAANKFVLTRCPWCGAQMGPIKTTGKGANVPKCPGYERAGPTIVYKCTDPKCDFTSGLPILVIDEDIYEERPTLIIGTVDKFAMLAWRPEARSIFGIGGDGDRVCSPPGLIIQDELHLISGPLGSIVGLYEGVIEELCTDRRVDPPVIPKLVSSTATIRRYEDQIRGLYGRGQVALFPPPGVTSADSFFARHEQLDASRGIRGRTYVGVHAPGLGSMQTVQVRTFAALLQAPMSLSSRGEQDPWWTLLTFFNSLRELGTTLSLLQSDIKDYLNTLRVRYALKFPDMRIIKNYMELTGRLRGDEVQEAIDSLEVPADSKSAKPIDVCLSSNIIEVGIDIDRLSLICIVGQPKTTSQYIQVTGRVGRRREERPGLVVTLYGASKPRDRSHFERFRSYHERLYAQVEPTSVTPFSPPALDRALHAAMTAYARQAGTMDVARSPTPYPEVLMEQLHDILLRRVRFIDPQEEDNFERVYRERERQWKRWQRIHWEGQPTIENTPLLREAGAYVPQSVANISWAMPMSMRNVDAGCEIEITQNYLNEAGSED